MTPKKYKMVIQVKNLTEEQLNKISIEGYKYMDHYCITERVMPPGPMPKDDDDMLMPYMMKKHVFIFEKYM
jgi:hypothetical protein